ncbi:phage tail protein [Pseudomonas sp. C2B4]|uniref:phage tail protein n=1 Tax=Pseudomonas sp. C2B4 TaxID=2735270 RepID=UPI002114DEEC|nr:phage tail protein [Pseudomonas sp. C2B4]
MADYYTLLTNAGIAYETACKAAGVPIKLSQISVGDGAGAIYNPAATDTALKREVWRGPLNALFQDEKNPSWLLAEVTIPPEVGGWYVREAGLWTDTGILYAIVKYPESFKPVLATSGSGKEFYIRSIFETSNAALVTLLIDDTVVKATRAWVTSYVADELAKLDNKQSVRVATTNNIVLTGAQTIDGVAVIAGDRVLVKNQASAKDNGLYVVANAAWMRSEDANTNAEVTSALQVSVEQGTTQADSRWQLVTDGVIVLGTTALIFQNVTYGFAPLASPALVGVPTAPTAAPGANSTQIATTGFVQQEIAADLATAAPLMDGAAAVGTSTKLTREDHRHPTDTSRAPLASPALTGIPTAPTAAAGTNTTQIATTAFIQSAVAALVASSPAALDTLSELATALGNDPNFATTMTNQLATKAPLASPALTGTPTAPTPGRFDTTTKLATMAAVQARGLQYSSVTATASTLTGVLAHVGGIVHFSCFTASSYSLPDSVVNSLPAGATVRIQNWSPSVAITLTVQGTDKMQETISVGTPSSTARTIPADTYVDAIHLGTGTWLLTGTGMMGKTTLFASSQTSNGWQKLPNGLILQWCQSAYVTAGGSGSVAFPIVFPNACIFAIAAPLGFSASTSSGNVVAGDVSPSGMTLYNWGPITAPAKIFAIGG